jgi:hypothetical protein
MGKSGPQWDTVTTSYDDNNNEVDHSDEEFVAAAKWDFKH